MQIRSDKVYVESTEHQISDSFVHNFYLSTVIAQLNYLRAKDFKLKKVSLQQLSIITLRNNVK